MGLKDIFKKKNKIEELADETLSVSQTEEETEEKAASEAEEIEKEEDEIKEFVQETMNNADFQIRFMIEHKILPAKLNDDPVYVITALIADKGAYINNFYNGIYTQNQLKNPYKTDDFKVSAPFDIAGVKAIRIDMPEENLNVTLCKSAYVVYNDKYTKFLYLMVEKSDDNSYKLGSWIDGEHEEYDMTEENVLDVIAEIIEDEEVTQEKYTDIIEKLFAQKVQPTGLFAEPEEIRKHAQIYMNAIMQTQKFKDEDKRDEALKLIKDVIRKESGNYVDTDDKEYHCFRNAFEVLLYANHTHPYNYEKQTRKQIEGMQVDLSSAYLVYGAMMLEKQQYDKAIDILWKAVECNPVNIQMTFALADAYKGKGYYKTYFNLMKRAHVYAVRKVDIARIYRNYAFYYMQIKNYDFAALLAYASKYFEKDEKLFNGCLSAIEKEADKKFEEPTVDYIKKSLLANGITWGTKELALSVANMLNQQLTQAQNEQGIKMTEEILAELKPEM